MSKETLQVAEFIEIYKLSENYEGVQIIGESKVRTPKEHNLEVIKRRESKPKDLVLS